MPGMTPAERLVGRRMPAAPKHIDTLMASFVAQDGTFCGRLAPSESWLRPSHLKARRRGWLTYSGMSIKMAGDRGRGAGLWYPTAEGEIEAVAAKVWVQKAEEARHTWCTEHQGAYNRFRSLAEAD